MYLASHTMSKIVQGATSTVKQQVVILRYHDYDYLNAMHICQQLQHQHY